MKLKIASLFSLFFLFLFSSCADKPISQLSPDDGIQRIRKQHQDRDWEKTISDVDEYRSRYPYTQFAAEAEILQADAYFQAKRYSESVATYEAFLSKNPSHKEAPQAAFRVARSYDLQAPEEIDREQNFSIKAIEKYQFAISKHPKAEWVKEAKDRIQTLKHRLAEHHLFIAKFYFKKESFHSVISRGILLLEQFPEEKEMRIVVKKLLKDSYMELAELLKEEKTKKNPDLDKFLLFKNNSPEELIQKASAVDKQYP